MSTRRPLTFCLRICPSPRRNPHSPAGLLAIRLIAWPACRLADAVCAAGIYAGWPSLQRQQRWVGLAAQVFLGRGLITAAQLTARVQELETMGSAGLGPRMVARAWTDPGALFSSCCLIIALPPRPCSPSRTS